MTAADDRHHEFDFVFGGWTVHNRKLVDVADPDCEQSFSFDDGQTWKLNWVMQFRRESSQSSASGG
jgi:hypothetical protein